MPAAARSSTECHLMWPFSAFSWHRSLLQTGHIHDFDLLIISDVVGRSDGGGCGVVEEDGGGGVDFEPCLPLKPSFNIVICFQLSGMVNVHCKESTDSIIQRKK
ncbi:hypothetical protein L1987_60829 [Smallanthus sonchifolius]|uniref:Uncharacterized protein n=1 Tax=Smallanthus sonchifolius TaxID=185202 RepID=A0ACB9DA19_9ASTR|nr:hypothetical protein L1987_60829 [Smallanthus sonchifolius]